MCSEASDANLPLTEVMANHVATDFSRRLIIRTMVLYKEHNLTNVWARVFSL